MASGGVGAALGARLASGRPVVLDGATGTELQRRGVPMHAVTWSAAALLTHPAVVRAVHADYVRAGADVVTADTFATNRALLAGTGLEGEFETLNRRAVALARSAVEQHAGDRSVAVAGSLNLWDPPADPARAEAEVAEQAALLADAGVDLLVLEMMVAVDETLLALRAARSTGLPVWAGFSVRPDAAGRPCLLRREEPLADALDAVADLGPRAVLVMHSTPEDTDPALAVVRERWSGVHGAYAHRGRFTMPEWHFEDIDAPAAYAGHARRWMDAGALIVGGCCGYGPDHIAALAALTDSPDA